MAELVDALPKIIKSLLFIVNNFYMRADILKNKQKILNWIKESKSKAFMCRELVCRPDTLNSWLKKLEIEYSGNQSSKGQKSSKKLSALEYLNGTYIKSDKLRIKLIEDGIKEAKCEECKKTKWLGVNIPLELHHKDGNRFNNELKNLQILCCNCHALTKNHGSKNNYYKNIHNENKR